MDKDAKECLVTAAELLQQATGCQPSVAGMIVESIALGTIRWQGESSSVGHQADQLRGWLRDWAQAKPQSPR